MINAREAIALWAQVLTERGMPMPLPRSLTDLKADPETASELSAHMVALIPFGRVLRAGAE